MSRHHFFVSGLVAAAAFAAWSPSAAQVAPLPTGGDSQAPVELPLPPVAATPVPEPAPVAAAVAPTTAAPAYGAVTDTLTVLVEYRPESEIAREMQNAVAEKERAGVRIEQSRMMAAMAASRIEIKASEIKALDAEIGFAKSQKNESRKNELQDRRRFAESEKQLLERRRDLREREIESARAVRAYHEANEKACRLEMDLATSRRAVGSLTGTAGPGAVAEYSRLRSESLKLEGRVLEARVERANKLKELADQEVKLGKVRRTVYDSQLKVNGAN